jgi:hypothetical protein
MKSKFVPMEEIDWLAYLNHWFPHIGRVYLSQREQNLINSKLKKRFETLDSGLQYQTNFYDNLVRVIQPQMGTPREREVSLKLLTFLNDQIGLFFNLVNNDDKLIKQFKGQLNNLFQINGDKYLDKVGEVASTLYLMKTLTLYTLTELEFKYEKSLKGRYSKDVDLLFTSTTDGHIRIIDIFNLTLDFKKIKNETLLKKLLDHRLSEKINDKAFTSPHVKEHFREAYIQPFIWIFDMDTVFKYKPLLNTIHAEHVLPLLCLRQRTDRAGHLFYDCIRVSEI